MSTRPSDGVGEGRGGGKSGNAAPPHPLPHHPHARPQPELPPSPPPSRSRESEVPSHPVPHEDPHKLQGDLRHRVDARGSPPASSVLTGPGAAASPAAATTTPDDPRHQAETTLEQPAAASQPQPQEQQGQPPPVQVQDLPAGGAPASPSELPYPTFFDPFAPAELEVISVPSSSGAGTPAPRIVDHDRIRSLASGDPSPASTGTATPYDIPPNEINTQAATTTTSTTDHSTDHAGRRPLKSLRPLVQAVMAFEKGRKFSTGTSVHRKRQMSTLIEKEGHFGPALTVRLILVCIWCLLFPCHCMLLVRDRIGCMLFGEHSRSSRRSVARSVTRSVTRSIGRSVLGRSVLVPELFRKHYRTIGFCLIESNVSFCLGNPRTFTTVLASHFLDMMLTQSQDALPRYLGRLLR